MSKKPSFHAGGFAQLTAIYCQQSSLVEMSWLLGKTVRIGAWECCVHADAATRLNWCSCLKLALIGRFQLTVGTVLPFRRRSGDVRVVGLIFGSGKAGSYGADDVPIQSRQLDDRVSADSV